MKISKAIKPVDFLQLVAWGVGIGAILGYIATRFSWGFGYGPAIGMVTACVFLMEGLGYLSTTRLYPLFEKYPRGKKLTCQLISSSLAHLLGWLIPVYILAPVIGFNFFRLEVLLCLAVFIIFAIMINSISLVVRFYRKLAQKEIAEEEFKRLAAQAELKALKAQINPHFLFNSLNTIASLIAYDSHEAERSVERLAEVFRYVLSASDRDFVTLAEELDFIDSYLEIERARFGDRLKVSRNIEPGTLQTPIPGLVLQPLVENSIKHGSCENGEMRIEIATASNGRSVTIEIKDEGKGMPEAVQRGHYDKGTGLRNVKERLWKIYGEGYGLHVQPNNPRGTTVVITLPGDKI